LEFTLTHFKKQQEDSKMDIVEQAFLLLFICTIIGVVFMRR